jgi:hypothetical protein
VARWGRERMIERIAKLDAAERQLTAAIRLFFQEGSA